MNNSPIKAVIITGHYAAGKGDVMRELQRLVDHNFPAFTVSLQTDRQFLNEAVLRDVKSWNAPQPGVEGPHSIIREQGPPLVFDVKDGSLHHEAHSNMVQSIQEIPKGVLGIYEIASGPDVPSFGLRQSGEHLVGLLQGFRVIDHTLVVDVTAPYEVRLGRNAGRQDKVSNEIMAIAAIDGGEVFQVKHLLGDRYHQLDNAQNGGLSGRVAEAFDVFIRPKLETTLAVLEGSQQNRERRG